jgi:hypothetical protein
MASFERDIRPLFRDTDRDEMRPYFDLWSAADVAANADRILERLELGDMPCDEPWTPGEVQRLRAWVDEGAPP